jgi:hypothetical protein
MDHNLSLQTEQGQLWDRKDHPQIQMVESLDSNQTSARWQFSEQVEDVVDKYFNQHYEDLDSHYSSAAVTGSRF